MHGLEPHVEALVRARATTVLSQRQLCALLEACHGPVTGQAVLEALLGRPPHRRECRSFGCRWCDRVYASSDAVLKHVKKRHPEARPKLTPGTVTAYCRRIA
jgi:hypothetical protein